MTRVGTVWRVVSVALVLGVAVQPAQPAWAADGVSFAASVDRTRLEIGETLTLEVTVTVPDKRKISQLVLPTYEGFDLVSQSRSSQMSFSFGSGGQSLQQTEVHRLILLAVKTGAQTITPGILQVGAHTFNTRPIVLTVLKVGQSVPRASPGPRGAVGGPPGAGRANPFDPFGGFDPFDILRGGGVPVTDDDIVLRATVDKRAVVLGEQVTFYVQVLARTDISDFPSFKLPKLDGFWVEDLESPKRITPTVKYVKGVPYRAYLLRRKALFPVREGKLTIDPVEVEIATGLGFLRTGRRVTRRSRPVVIDVAPLPTAGKPKGFPSANVGQWSFEVKASADRVPLGQTVTLRITARGRGNLNALTLPKVEGADGFRVYDPTEKVKPQVRGSSFGGTKTMEVVLVPQRSGHLRVPGLVFSTFDPVQGRYLTRRSEPIEIEVSAGSGGAATRAAGGSGASGTATPSGPANVLDPEGLRTIRYGAALFEVSPDPWRQPAFAWALGLPLLLFSLLFAGGRARAIYLKQIGADVGRRAQGVARSRLKAARRLRRKGAWGEAFAETERALLDYIAEKTQIPARGMPRGDLGARLLELGYDPDVVGALCTVLERAETARYSPGDPSAEQVESLLEKAAEVLGALDDVPVARRAA